MSARSVLTCAALVILAIALAQQAAAQDPAAAYTCSRSAGTMVIRYAPDLDDKKPVWPKGASVVHFMSLLVVDEPASTVVDTNARTFRCSLAADRFEVTFKPGVANVNMLGRCGDAVTGVVTVKRNGELVLDEREFEAINCHERDTYIDRITFRDGSPKPEIVHRGYEYD